MKKKTLAMAFLLVIFLIGTAQARIVEGSITVATTAQRLSGLPAAPYYAILTVETGSVRYWYDQAPTSTVGHKVDAGEVIYLTDGTQIGGFQVILDTGSGSATIRYSILGN